MKPNFAEKSLSPLYKDFTSNGQSHCVPCNRPLTTETAIFLMANGQPRPFGPVCAKLYASKSLVGIPDLTKNVYFDREDETDVKPGSVATDTVEGSKRQHSSPEQKRLADAVSYALLRARRLPEMGFQNVKWHLMAEFLKGYELGNPDAKLLKAVTTTIRKSAETPSLQHLSLQNLNACYVFGTIIDKIWAKTRKPSNRLVTADYNRWRDLNDTLKRELLLTPDNCAEVVDMAKRYLPYPPTVKGASFVASRPNPQQ